MNSNRWARLRKHGPTLLKWTISLGLLGFLLQKLSGLEAAAEVLPRSVGLAVLAFIAVLAAECLGGFRFALCCGLVEVPVSARAGVSIHFGALPFQLTLPGGLGGDAYKIHALTRRQVNIGRAILAAGLDRMIGAAVLVGVAMLLALPLIMTLLPASADQQMPLIYLIGLAIMALSGGLAILLSKRVRHVLLEAAQIVRRLPRRPGTALAAVALALLAQVCLAGATLLLLGDRPEHVSLLTVLGATTAAIFMSMLPISLGGFGVREGSLTVLLVAAGVPLPDAIATSIQLGFLILLTVAPGLIMWLAESRNRDTSSHPHP